MPHKGRLTVPEKLAAQYLALGMHIDEVASSTDLSLSTLNRVSRDPLFMGEVDRCRSRAFPLLAERLTKRLEELQEPALERMADLMQAESEPVQFQAAKDLLNRGPLQPKPSSPYGPGQGQGLIISLDQQALQAIIGGAMNIGNAAILTAFSSLGSSPLLPVLQAEPTLHEFINTGTTFQEEEEEPTRDAP